MNPYFCKSSEMTWLRMLFSSAGSLNRWLDGIKKLEFGWIWAPKPILYAKSTRKGWLRYPFPQSGFDYLLKSCEGSAEYEENV